MTASRILGSSVLIFIKPFTAAFYLVYIFCGLTDMTDGAVARRFHSESQFGERLDSIADICFVAVCAVKLLPILAIPLWLWIFMGVIAAVRAANIICAKIFTNEFAVSHTAANKITGAMLFILPLTVKAIDIGISGVIVGSVALFSALQEMRMILKNKNRTLKKKEG